MFPPFACENTKARHAYLGRSIAPSPLVQTYRSEQCQLIPLHPQPSIPTSRFVDLTLERTLEDLDQAYKQLADELASLVSRMYDAIDEVALAT
jgi:hypothetical protein